MADAAGAIGAKYKGRNIGALADATVFSFNGNKTITCGGGGAVVGDNKRIIELAGHLAATARVGQDYEHDMVGYNYRMTNLQAAVGCAQIERLEEFVARKRYISGYYKEHLKEIAGVTFFPETEWEKAPVGLPDLSWMIRGMSGRYAAVWQRRIYGQSRSGVPVYMQKPYVQAERSGMDVTGKLWKHILPAPASTCLSDEQLEDVVMAVKEIL